MLPVSFSLIDETIVLRTAVGSTFDVLVRGASVVFEVDHADPAYHSGWSVIGHGTAESMDGEVPERALDRLALRPWGWTKSPGWIGIRLFEVTGRRIMPVASDPGSGPIR
jgi:nitroimidazol reductase NimA-like FMN-containing flavoprotein (pyridoxamine 5'-phosphate oxidase superfamily)